MGCTEAKGGGQGEPEAYGANNRGARAPVASNQCHSDGRRSRAASHPSHAQQLDPPKPLVHRHEACDVPRGKEGSGSEAVKGRPRQATNHLVDEAVELGHDVQ
eukprot:1089008-Alexandrium_andersonii.AAC.1